MPVFDTQGTYIDSHVVAYPGMIAELQPSRDVFSRRVTTGSIAFGLAAGAGAADGTVRLGGTGFQGITVADKTRMADLYAVDEFAALIREGTVWVTASTAVTPADPVTFTAATGVIGAGLATTIANAKFETTAAIGALVKVYLG